MYVLAGILWVAALVTFGVAEKRERKAPLATLGFVLLVAGLGVVLLA